VTVSVTSPP